MEIDTISSRFFKTFARFEYALKASGYHNGDGEAKSNWRKFAESLESLFKNPSSDQLQDAIQYFIDHQINIFS
jgi:hypothetical protein